MTKRYGWTHEKLMAYHSLCKRYPRQKELIQKAHEQLIAEYLEREPDLSYEAAKAKTEDLARVIVDDLMREWPQ